MTVQTCGVSRGLDRIRLTAITHRGRFGNGAPPAFLCEQPGSRIMRGRVKVMLMQLDKLADAKITKNFVFGGPNGIDFGFASTLRAAPASQSVLLRSARTAFEFFADAKITKNFVFGDPNGIRTRVTAVKGQCPNRWTIGSGKSR